MYLVVLLSMCLGLINAARGSGIANMKFPELGAMWLAAFTVTHNWYISVAFFAPQAILFATGTGQYMPFITKYMSWRTFEALSVTLFSLISGIIFYVVK